MIIDFEGRTLFVPPHIEETITRQIFGMVARMYQDKVPAPMRMGLKAFSREQIAKMERMLNEQGRDGKLVRPPSGADPTLHYLWLMFRTYQETLKDAILLIDSEETGSDTVGALSLSIPDSGQGGGSLSSGWHFGVGQNDGGEDVGPGVGEALSNESPLHS